MAALVAAGVVLLSGGTEERASSPESRSVPQAKPTPAEKKAAAERNAKRRLTLKLEPVWIDDPGGNWAARLPQGEGWTKPENNGDLNGDPYNPLYRTTAWGPSGFVVVDTSPAEDPTLNQENFTVAGEVIEAEQVASTRFALAQMISYRNGEDECAGAPCVKVMLSDGAGGGVTIWVKAGSMKEAKAVARTFAESAERRY